MLPQRRWARPSVATLSVGSTPLAPAGPRGLTRLARANERLFYGILGFVVIGILWELAGDLGLYRKSLLSTPSLVWSAAVQDFGSGTIWPDLSASGVEFGLGFVAALGIGIPLGLAIGMFRRVEYLVSFLLFGIYSTPKAAIAPLIILVAGIGLESKVILVFLLAFFSVIVSTVAGVRSVAERHLDIADSFGASRWLRFRSVILPSTFPFILTGIRIATGRALVGGGSFARTSASSTASSDSSSSGSFGSWPAILVSTGSRCSARHRSCGPPRCRTSAAERSGRISPRAALSSASGSSRRLGSGSPSVSRSACSDGSSTL
ncbi:MAG: ABC transporter permease [Chloroflexi bacterium]|nr:MAG: ABC transporter permease [Chloroflexota bacterium]